MRKRYRLPQTNRSRYSGARLALYIVLSALCIACLWVLYRQIILHEKSQPPTFKPHVAVQQPSQQMQQHGTTQPLSAQPESTKPYIATLVATTGVQDQFPRPVKTVLEAQIALVRHGISPGLIDGVFGPKTSVAIAVYQQRYNLPVTGQLDDATKTALVLAAPALTNYAVTSNDVARLQPLSKTWLGKSQQNALEYESVLELIAEKTFSHPNLICLLNPQINWTNVPIGTALIVPNVAHPNNSTKAAFIQISLSGKWLQAFDQNTNLLVHFPCSIARRVEKRPIGVLHVTCIVPNPNYTFDPANFPESAEARQLNQKLILPPGPNNPVGVAWIGLDKPGYGIHGTPAPERVGRSESHGCFRLANWNAEYLLHLVWIGMPVYIKP